MPEEQSFIDGAGNTVDVRALASKAAPHATLTRVMLIGGLALFAILVWRSGPASIGSLIMKVGWALPLVFLPNTLVNVLQAAGWWFAFPEDGCPIRLSEILRFTISAKAIQYVTPSISQAAELLKFHLLRRAGQDDSCFGGHDRCHADVST